MCYGEVYKVIERSQDALMKQLWRSYNRNPSALSVACIENLTNGPKLSNNDNTEFPNPAEQLEAVSMNKKPVRMSDDGRSSVKMNGY